MKPISLNYIFISIACFLTSYVGIFLLSPCLPTRAAHPPISRMSVEVGGDVGVDRTGEEDASEFMRDKDTGSIVDGFNKFLTRYKRLVAFIFGLATLTMLVILIISIFGIGVYSASPRERAMYVKRTIICLCGFGIFGSFTLFFSLAFHVFR